MEKLNENEGAASGGDLYTIFQDTIKDIVKIPETTGDLIVLSAFCIAVYILASYLVSFIKNLWKA